MAIDNKGWMLYRIQFCPSKVQVNATTEGTRHFMILMKRVQYNCIMFTDVAYARIVILGVTEENVGSFLKV